MKSTKRLAKIAGILYLTNGIFGGFAYGAVLKKVFVPGNAALTAKNVASHPELVRLGVVADLIQATVFVFLVMALYLLLKDVNKNVARAMVIFVSIATTIMCLNDVFQFAALSVATDPSYANALGVQGSNSLVLLLLDMQHHGFLIAQIFFGLWLAPLGYLAYKSGKFPKSLGVILNMATVSYLLDVLLLFLFPNFGAKANGSLSVVPIIAELWMVAYLLFMGFRSAKDADATLSVVREDTAVR